METNTHHSIEVPKFGYERFIPKELAYCNSEEFKHVCALIYHWQLGTLHFGEFRVQCVHRILELIPGKRKLDHREMEAFHANIYQISELIDSFFNKGEDNKLELKQNFVHNHTPYVRPLFVKLTGPTERFTNVSFGQYVDGLNIFHLYIKTKNVKFLYQLMATFYMSAYDQYNPDKTEKRAEIFEKYVDFGKVYGFFLLFGSMQSYITSSKVMVEGQVIDLSILFQENEEGFKSDIPGLGVKSLSYQLAESQVFGNLNEVRKEKLWEILLRLYDVRKRDLDNQAQMKKAEEEAKSKANAN